MASRRRARVRAASQRVVERVTGRLLLRTYQILTVETPVDTGFARAGWTPSTGAPDLSGPSERPSDETLAAAQASALFGRRSATAQAIDRSYKLRQGVVFLRNPVRYIRFLNEGTSPQAQPMWIERALQTALQRTRQELQRGI